jgi:hypothetical protein
MSEADSSAAIPRLDNHVGFPLLRIGRLLILFACRSVEFMHVGTLLINRGPVAAAQQLFADTAPTSVANIKHKQKSFADFLRLR